MDDSNWTSLVCDEEDETFDTLAELFLLAPDMSCTNQQLDMMNPANYTKESAKKKQTKPSIGSETRCICNSRHDSELMIQCDSCKKWLHSECVRLVNTEHVSPFICIFCQYKVAIAIKMNAKTSLQRFLPIIQQMHQEERFKFLELSKEILEVIRDIQEILHMTPSFLPPQTRPNAADLASNQGSSENTEYDSDG